MVVSAIICDRARQATSSTVVLQARKKLEDVPKDKKKYEALLTDLLVQALVKLKQPAVIVKGREVGTTAAVPQPSFITLCFHILSDVLSRCCHTAEDTALLDSIHADAPHRRQCQLGNVS